MSGAALAVLNCQSTSHPFQDRHITLHEAVKVGRAVARARPAANNAIFDCKVLSRNHALLWYSNGKVSLHIAIYICSAKLFTRSTLYLLNMYFILYQSSTFKYLRKLRSFLMEDLRICLSYNADHIIAADDLVTQGAQASAAMILTLFVCNHPCFPQ